MTGNTTKVNENLFQSNRNISHFNSVAVDDAQRKTQLLNTLNDGLKSIEGLLKMVPSGIEPDDYEGAKAHQMRLNIGLMNNALKDYNDNKHVEGAEYTDTQLHARVLLSNVQELSNQLHDIHDGRERRPIIQEQKINPNFDFEGMGEPVKESYFADDGPTYNGPRVVPKVPQDPGRHLANGQGEHLGSIKSAIAHNDEDDIVHEELSEIDKEIKTLRLQMVPDSETQTFDGKLKQMENNISKMMVEIESSRMGGSVQFADFYKEAVNVHDETMRQIGTATNELTYGGREAAGLARMNEMKRFNSEIKGKIKDYYPELKGEAKTQGQKDYVEARTQLDAYIDDNKDLARGARKDMRNYIKNRPSDPNYEDEFLGRGKSGPDETEQTREQEQDNMKNYGVSRFPTAFGFDSPVPPIGYENTLKEQKIEPTADATVTQTDDNTSEQPTLELKVK